MRHFVLAALAAFLVVSPAEAQNKNQKKRPELVSPFKSTVKDISIANTHVVEDRKGFGQILRGMEPRKKVRQLRDAGVTDVLIFKNQKKTEVDDQIEALKKLGYRDENIHHIPLEWKDFKELETPCRQTVQALRIMRATRRNPGEKLFFHCTVGEDRTGLLAGVYRMVFHRWSVHEAFDDEMCERGYSAGDLKKAVEAFKVVQHLRDGLTPLYLRMAMLVREGRLNARTLDPRVCRFDKRFEARFKRYQRRLQRRFWCPTSSQFPAGTPMKFDAQKIR